MNTTHIRVLLALASIMPLAACDSARSGAEAAVRENLKDPESARFGEFYYNEDTKRACLTVNAKNSFGGYGEEQEASLINRSSGWVVDDIANVAHEGCIISFADNQD